MYVICISLTQRCNCIGQFESDSILPFHDINCNDFPVNTLIVGCLDSKYLGEWCRLLSRPSLEESTSPVTKYSQKRDRGDLSSVSQEMLVRTACCKLPLQVCDHVWQARDKSVPSSVPVQYLEANEGAHSQSRHPRPAAAYPSEEAARRGARTPNLVLCTAPRRAEQVQRMPPMRAEPI